MLDILYQYAIIVLLRRHRLLSCLATMASRRAVLLLPPGPSIHPTQLPSYNSTVPETPLESTLLQVFILKNLNSIRMNTYKKTGGRGVLWLTKNSSRCCLSEYAPLPASSHSERCLAQITINYPLSPQSLTKCSSRNSFVLKMMHFHGGVYPLPICCFTFWVLPITHCPLPLARPLHVR